MFGEIVWKYEIYSKLTKWMTLEDLTIKWDASMGVINRSKAILCTMKEILREWNSAKGVFTEFAKLSDSGSFILCIIRDPSESVEKETVVI